MVALLQHNFYPWCVYDNNNKSFRDDGTFILSMNHISGYVYHIAGRG